ncbi:MAG: flippase-like domain-containing protein [Candidatus Omnitrophica bacterium]|nr:flippase-like domain-containing protein [Candidatus Omnitrophota bacterium]
MKKKIGMILRVFISVTLVGGIFYVFRDKLDEIIELLANADVSLVCIAFVGGIANAVLFGLRLRSILAAQGVKVSLYNAFVVVMAGYFFGNFVPSSVGVDLVKGTYLAKGTNKIKETFSSILIDRVIGLSTLIMIAVAAIVIRQDLVPDGNVKRSIIMMAVFAVAICLFFTNKRLGRLARPFLVLVPHKKIKDSLRDFYLAIHEYKDRPGILFVSALISVIAQLVFFYCIYLLAVSIGIDVPAFFYLIFLPIISLAAVAPSLNGMGVRDVMFIYFFSPYSSPEEALAIAILVNAFFIFLGIVGGGVLGLSGTLKIDQVKEAAESVAKIKEEKNNAGA